MSASVPGFLDRFLPALVANAMAMVAVVGGVMWHADRSAQQTRAREAQLDRRIDQVSADNTRLQALNHELAAELHALDTEGDVLRWQLRYTQDKLNAQPSPARRSRVTRRSPQGDAPPRAKIQILDAPAAARLARDVDDLAQGGLDLADFEPDIPAIRAAPSQLDRDLATHEWDTLIQDVARRECGDGSGAASWRCHRQLDRLLTAYTQQAVDCIVSGNAAPDYVEGVELSALPSHSVPLQRGAIIMCDGALSDW